MMEPKLSCSVYVLAAGVAWLTAFTLIMAGWVLRDMYVSFVGVYVVGAAAALSVSISCWRLGRNLKAAMDYGREVERREAMRVAR